MRTPLLIEGKFFRWVKDEWHFCMDIEGIEIQRPVASLLRDSTESCWRKLMCAVAYAELCVEERRITYRDGYDWDSLSAEDRQQLHRIRLGLLDWITLYDGEEMLWA